MRQLIAELQGSAFSNALADVNLQLQYVLSKGFLHETPTTWFRHLPRFIQALARRLERLRGNASRDAELSRQITPFVTAYVRLQAAHSAEIEQLKWMIEEFRVSLFAQDLRTSIPVSAKRLSEQQMLAEKSV